MTKKQTSTSKKTTTTRKTQSTKRTTPKVEPKVIEQPKEKTKVIEPKVGDVLLRNILYRVATGKQIPGGYETYWIDGNIPKNISEASASNVGIRRV